MPIPDLIANFAATDSLSRAGDCTDTAVLYSSTDTIGYTARPYIGGLVNIILINELLSGQQMYCTIFKIVLLGPGTGTK